MVTAMSRCRATSFYVAPGVMLYFAECTIAIVAADGSLTEVTHRSDVARFERDHPDWDGLVVVGPRGGMYALCAQLAADATQVQMWRVDSRVVEGRRPKDAATFALHRCVMKDVNAAGGVASLVQALAPTAPRSLRKALGLSVGQGAFHSAHVVSSAWRSGLLADPNVAVRLLESSRMPLRVIPDGRLEALFATLTAGGRAVDVEALLSELVSPALLDAGAQRILAKNPATPPALLQYLLLHSNEPDIAWKAATNPSTPSEALVAALSSGDHRVRERAMENPNMPQHILSAALVGDDVDMAIAAAYNKSCPPEALVEAFSSSLLRSAIAANPNLPVSCILEALADEDVNVAFRAAMNPSAPPEALTAALSHDQERVRVAAATNAATSAADLVGALRDPSPEVRLAAASHSAPPDALAAALFDQDRRVRRAAARNSHTAPDALAAALRGDDHDLQLEAARNPSTPRQALAEAFVSGDQRVRAAVVGNPSIPSELVDAAMSDPDRTLRYEAVLNPIASPAALSAVMTDPLRVPLRAGAAGNPSAPWDVVVGCGHDDVIQSRAVLEDRPMPLDTACDLSYDRLVKSGAEPTDSPTVISSVTDIGAEALPFRFPEDTLRVRHTLHSSTVSVNGEALQPRVLSSGRQLRENATFMGNCTKTYADRIRDDSTLVVAFDTVGPDGGRRTVYNVSLERDLGGRWSVISEVNSRFNDGIDSATRSQIEDQLNDLLEAAIRSSRRP